MAVSASGSGPLLAMRAAVGNRTLSRLLEAGDSAAEAVQRNGKDKDRYVSYGTFSPTRKASPLSTPSSPSTSYQSGPSPSSTSPSSTSLGSGTPEVPMEFSPVEKQALDVLGTTKRAGKAVEHASKNPFSAETYSQLAPSSARSTWGAADPLLPETEQLQKWRTRDLGKGVAKYAVGKGVDTATGIPLSGAFDTLSTGADSLGTGKSLPRGDYEEIRDSPDVEKARATLSTYLKKTTASKASKVVGGFGGAAGGAVLGSAVPVVGTIIGGILGGLAGSKAAEKATDTVTDRGADRSDAYMAVLTLHNAARRGDATALATLVGFGVDEDTVMAPDGWKAVVEKLGVSGGLTD